LPGSYGQVAVKRTATLTLHSGKYFVDTLELEPGAKVVIDDAAGPVLIYVRRILTVRATLSTTDNHAPNVLLGYFGTNPGVIETQLKAVVIAPNATLQLSPNVPANYSGVFLAQRLELGASSTVTYSLDRKAFSDARCE
jgi:hypothetical protein